MAKRVGLSRDSWRYAILRDSNACCIRSVYGFMQLKLKQKENDSLIAPYSRSYNRTLISTIVEAADGGVHAVSLSHYILL